MGEKPIDARQIVMAYGPATNACCRMCGGDGFDPPGACAACNGTGLANSVYVRSVWNKRDPRVPRDAVYVGRPTVWGNPFSHLDAPGTFRVSSRDKAVACYILWLEAQPELVARAQKELRGKDLVCWCAPARCHAHVLMAIANSTGKFVCTHPYLIGGGATGECASCGANIPF